MGKFVSFTNLWKKTFKKSLILTEGFSQLLFSRNQLEEANKLQLR